MCCPDGCGATEGPLIQSQGLGGGGHPMHLGFGGRWEHTPTVAASTLKERMHGATGL